MSGDYETAKLVTLSVVFVVLVAAAIVIAARDARRQRLEHERRVRRQVDLLRLARAEAERRPQPETQAGNVDFETGTFQPSEFIAMELPPPPSDRSGSGAGRTHGGGAGTFNAA